MSIKTIPDELQYMYYGICELVGIPTANDLLDSGELAEWVKKNRQFQQGDTLRSHITIPAGMSKEEAQKIISRAVETLTPKHMESKE